MATSGGPNIERDGLIFAIDSDSNVRGYTKYGTSGTNNNHRAIRNLIDKTSAYSMSTTSQLTGGVTYYTLYGITYPEGNYSPASRQGITDGFENITSGKRYDMSRDLGYFVFDEDTNTWISDSFFNGERINGHCYDTYDGAPAQHATFQSDFDNISTTFPNATHIIIGSHASENVDNNADTVTRLKKIGLPDDAVGLGRVEFVLVGKVDKPWTHHYVRENVSSAVANMVIGLPLEGKGGALTFDGTDDYLDLPNNPHLGLNSASWEFIVKFDLVHDNETSTYRQIYIQEASIWIAQYFDKVGLDIRKDDNTWFDGNGGLVTGSQIGPVVSGRFYHIVMTWDGSNAKGYLNGDLGFTTAVSGLTGILNGTTPRRIGRRSGNALDGQIPVTKLYNRALSADEVQQNYNSYKNRFNL